MLAEGKLEFKASLKCKNHHQVIEKYGQLHAYYEGLMDRLKAGKSINSIEIEPLSTLKAKAAQVGIQYKPMDELIKANDPSLLFSRINLGEGLINDEAALQSLFGMAPELPTLNDVLAFYEENTREISKKKAPVQLAVKRANDFFGEDKPLSQITKQLALSYRSHMVDLVQTEELKAGTANKQIMHLRKIIRFYLEQNDLKQDNPFNKISLQEEKAARPAYSIPFLKEKWLRGTPFSSLNDESLHILYAIMDTGTGPKEICGLEPQDIHLDHEVPHIVIKPNKIRKLKTGHRGRQIPLIGQSLIAFKKYPHGFPSHTGPTGPDNFSANVNKYLKAHGLCETDEHGIYSLRHTFKDRMRKHKLPPELQNYLMGHKDGSIGAHYGSGYPLNDILDYMKLLEADWKN
ncbi:phage integrase family protein [Brucella rhizosphaerae]|uniref:Phage integrase family protein n=1 Tax=Brucella rhizosphaerae TaxID=571254 RepID=A0A256FAC0_9HYPH|nr:phage integrase family protein [Brucella rhizosphaerae]